MKCEKKEDSALGEKGRVISFSSEEDGFYRKGETVFFKKKEREREERKRKEGKRERTLFYLHQKGREEFIRLREKGQYNFSYDKPSLFRKQIFYSK